MTAVKKVCKLVYCVFLATIVYIHANHDGSGMILFNNSFNVTINNSFSDRISSYPKENKKSKRKTPKKEQHKRQDYHCRSSKQ